jgi:GT2 family glycosyltransferase
MAMLVLNVANVVERFVKRMVRRNVAGAAVALPLPSSTESGSADDSPVLAAQHRSLLHRIGRVVKRFFEEFGAACRVIVRGHPSATSTSEGELSVYEQWFSHYATLSADGELLLRRRVSLLERQPLMSIVMATYNTDHEFLREAITSVLSQVYKRFELLIADDCSPDGEVRAIVAEFAKRDARVRLIERSENGGISSATNSAIEAASGEWIVLMDHDDTLVPHALARVVLAIAEHPDASFFYSDEDKIDENGRPFTPYFKSDFDPILLLGQNYLCHLSTIRTSLVRELGGLRSSFDGAQDWDLFLRVTERLERSHVVHIPFILYHWRSHDQSTSKASSAKPWALEAGTRAVADALERRGVRAEIEKVKTTGFCRLRYQLPENPPLVSILIPTRDGKFLATCLRSVLDKTTYPQFEIVVIDNGSEKPATKALFDELGDRIVVVRDDSPFNYSALHNRAVPTCKGDVLVLLNDDTEVVNGDWLTEMVGLLLQPGNGAVGAKLLYPDGRIQHAGVVLGPLGLADHVGKLEHRDSDGYFGRHHLPSEFSACTAACLAVRRSTWERLGGLDEDFQVAWNDIDFCLRIRESGEQVAYTPLAELVHYESVSRGLDESGPALKRFASEVLEMRARWLDRIVLDPYYNPNLSLNRPLWEPAHPPRVSPGYTGIE